MPTPVHVENADGSHSIGVIFGKVFVPFATVDAAKVRHYVEDVPEPEKGSKSKPSEEASG